MTQPTAARPARVFHHRAFTLFWVARFLSTLGVLTESVTLGWLVYTVARQSNSVPQSAFLVGMVGLAQFLPLFALTLIAGEMADRKDRRAVILICLLVQIVCDLAFAALALGAHPSLIAIFAIAAVFGAARAFLSPASSALGPMLVPREILPKAIAWNSLGWQSGAVIGPWIGGALCAVSPVLAFAVAAGLYAAAMIALALMRAETRPQLAGGPRLQLIREGLVYVWRTRVVLGAISLDLAAVLLGGATALLPVYARDILQVGPHGFGLLRSGPAIGAAATAVVLSRWPVQRHAGLWMFFGVAVFGVATLVFAVSKILVLSIVALAVLGGADMISVYVRQSLVQIVTPDHMRGRVAAVSGVFIGASNELGEFETGLVARALGAVGAAIFGGVGSIAVTALWAKLFPSLRKADRLLQAPPAADGPQPVAPPRPA